MVLMLKKVTQSDEFKAHMKKASFHSYLKGKCPAVRVTEKNKLFDYHSEDENTIGFEYGLTDDKMEKLLGEHYPENYNLKQAKVLFNKTRWGTNPLDVYATAFYKKKLPKKGDPAPTSEEAAGDSMNRIKKVGSAILSMGNTMVWAKTKERTKGFKAARVIAKGESLQNYPELADLPDQYKPYEAEIRAYEYTEASNHMDDLVLQRERLHALFVDRTIKKYLTDYDDIEVLTENIRPAAADTNPKKAYVYLDERTQLYTIYSKNLAVEGIKRQLNTMVREITRADRIMNAYIALRSTDSFVATKIQEQVISLETNNLPVGDGYNHKRTYVYVDDVNKTFQIYANGNKIPTPRTFDSLNDEITISRTMHAYCHGNNLVWLNVKGSPPVMKPNTAYIFKDPTTTEYVIYRNDQVEETKMYSAIQAKVTSDARIIKTCFNVGHIEWLKSDNRPQTFKPNTAYVYFDLKKQSYALFSEYSADVQKMTLKEMKTRLIQAYFPTDDIEILAKDRPPTQFKKDRKYVYLDEKDALFNLYSGSKVPPKIINVDEVVRGFSPVDVTIQERFDLEKIEWLPDNKKPSVPPQGTGRVYFDEINQTYTLYDAAHPTGHTLSLTELLEPAVGIDQESIGSK